MSAHLQRVNNEPHIKRPVWKALETHYKRVRDLHLRDLFANDPTRGERMVAHGAGIYLDYSKNRITDHTLKLLTQLAEESGLQARIDAMFRGEKINRTDLMKNPQAIQSRVTPTGVGCSASLLVSRATPCCNVEHLGGLHDPRCAIRSDVNGPSEILDR